MLQFRHALRASQGARAYQEDCAAVWPDDATAKPRPPGGPADGTALVAVLADGMGGHAGGALASATICEVFIAHFVEGQGAGQKQLRGCLDAANDAIAARVAANPALGGMGATLVGVTVGSKGLSWISVGDSPMYLYRNGDLVQLNADHSLAPVIDQMVAQGKMTAEAARTDPRRHYLRSAVTGEVLDMVDESVRPLALAGGDVVLISSDGIHTLEPDDIKRLIAAYSCEGADAIAQAIVRAVDNAGEPHQDNTTVIVVTM